MVFGREDAGLTSEEVAACSHAASIRTSPDCPSLNLAQAVLTFLYELARPAAEATPAAPAERPPLGEMEQMFRQMEQVLERIALLNPARPGQGTYPLRRLIHRASPDREEVALLRSMWNQLAWSINDWRGRKRGQ
ncbi:MAG: hypothetical protein C0617_09825 [Desulfuromonas sp.]|nr:MAG: hypothetical protein C0617_09825 [Desulfuromonas sp.]